MTLTPLDPTVSGEQPLSVESAASTPAARRWAQRLHPHRAPSVVASVFVLLVLALAALAPATLATHDPFVIDLTAGLQPPSAAHWFGTDEAGRDLYSRVVHGTGLSLAIGLGAAALSLTLAVLLGSLASLADRVTVTIVNRFIEVLFAFPMLLLSLLVVAILGPGVATSVLAVGLGTAPGYARMVRGQILAARGAGYVEAATALGHGRGRVIRQHILPNALRPLIALFTMSVGQSIVWASGLSFLGLGVAPPSPEWGALLDAGRPYVVQAPWLTFIPGLVILALALSATVLGKHIQTRLESGD